MPLDHHFLAAMPGMGDPRFERSLIYVCVHNDDGAMGLVVNRKMDIGILDLLSQLSLEGTERGYRDEEDLASHAVLRGGPVDAGRGFVLHSGDVTPDSSVTLSETLFMNVTTDILKMIACGDGPRRFVVALGYTGWGPGQLDAEIRENVWLSCEAREDLIFDPDLPTKYDRALAGMGIDPAMLSGASGTA